MEIIYDWKEITGKINYVSENTQVKYFKIG